MIPVLYKLTEAIHVTLRALASVLNAGADRFAFCPDCGRNRYSGPACKNV